MTIDLRIIPGFSNYKVSMHGDIFSNGFQMVDKKGRKWTKLPRKMKWILTKLGYYHVKLIDDLGVKRFMYIHRAIALSFIPNPDNKPLINHLDGNKLNNEIENLEWCDQRRNMQHSYYELGKIGFKNKPITQFTLDGRKIKDWFGVNDAAKGLDFYNSSILRVLQGKQKTAYGFLWVYQ